MMTCLRRVGLVAVLGWSFAACGGDQEVQVLPADEWAGPDLEAISQALLERMDLQAGESVLLVGQAGRWDGLIPLLRTGVREAGAEDLGAVDVFGAALSGSEPTPFTDALASVEPADFQETLALAIAQAIDEFRSAEPEMQ